MEALLGLHCVHQCHFFLKLRHETQNSRIPACLYRALILPHLERHGNSHQCHLVKVSPGVTMQQPPPRQYFHEGQSKSLNSICERLQIFQRENIFSNMLGFTSNLSLSFLPTHISVTPEPIARSTSKFPWRVNAASEFETRRVSASSKPWNRIWKYALSALEGFRWRNGICCFLATM